jgi:hypothetical protein
VRNLLNGLGYDIVHYNAGEIRNKHIVHSITKENMSDKSVIGMFMDKSAKRNIAIVMDEIDGMNSGDKGGINALIKLIRPKKTKKQRLEPISTVPIVCIGNIHMDKKMKELMKVCVPVEIQKPSEQQMRGIIGAIFPDVSSEMRNSIVSYADSDLQILMNIYKLTYKCNDCITLNTFRDTLRGKDLTEDAKQLVKKCIYSPVSLDQHLSLINETDRTIVALLWHENIVDLLEDLPKDTSISIYNALLRNMCFADYIDRITFQKQIWQFNEMSSLIKTFYTNHIIHSKIPTHVESAKPACIRFTKVLTKYSTEYNNQQFIISLCRQMSMDKKDLFSYISFLRRDHSEEEISQILEINDISKLDVKRLLRFIDMRANINV